jgi:hypothetical protein
MFVARAQSASLEPLRAAQEDLKLEIDDRTADPRTGVQSLAANLQVVLDRGGDDEARFSVFRDGDGGSLGAEVLRVDEEGNLFTKGAVRPAAMDIAELHPVGEPVGAADVLVADREHTGRLMLAREAADGAVVGIVSSEPGVLLGSGLERYAASSPELAAQLDQARQTGDRPAEARLWRAIRSGFEASHAAVALGGTVPCKVDASFGAIVVGDLLTTSTTPGHAMRADDPWPGTVIGKALEPLEMGTGTIRVLVMLR